MRRRTKAREFALQALYLMDITRDSCDVSLVNLWQGNADINIEEEIKNFTEELVRGTTQNVKAIDAKIAQYATNWELKRMAFVDRNILRLSCYELMFRSDIPPKVSINEAVELAKKYSSDQAAKFVNGVLDKIKLEKDK
jgi:transcription antitermination factor NusB